MAIIHSRVHEQGLPEQLETDAEVAAKVEIIQHVDHVVQPVLVPPPQMVQNADLHQSLVMKPLLVAKNGQKR